MGGLGTRSQPPHHIMRKKFGRAAARFAGMLALQERLGMLPNE